MIMAQEHGFKLPQIHVPMRKVVSENFTVMVQSSVKTSNEDISVCNRIHIEGVFHVY